MITGFVRGQTLRLPAVYVAADTIDYLTAQFVFQTSEWDGLEIWSHWEKDGEVYDIRLEDGRITKDMHLNLSAGAWRVYLHGNRYADGVVVERITTGAAVFEVQPTGTLDGEPFPTVPPSAGEQIVASAVAAEAGAKEAAERAAASEEAAEKAEKSAQDAETGAVQAAQDAETSASAAKSSETNAAASEKNAADSAERAEQVAVANGYIEFELDNEDGILYLHRTDNIADEIDFELDEETGELEVIIE